MKPLKLKQAAQWAEWALAHPCRDLAVMNKNHYHHWIGPWRLMLVVDARPDVEEGWPCWHAMVFHGERARVRAAPWAPGRSQRGGRAPAWVMQPAVPVELWSRSVRQHAPRLLRALLAPVGHAVTERVSRADEALAEWARRSQLPGGRGEPLAGLAGRRRLTGDEAEQMETVRPGTMGAINPTFAALEPIPDDALLDPEAPVN